MVGVAGVPGRGRPLGALPREGRALRDEIQRPGRLLETLPHRAAASLIFENSIRASSRFKAAQ